MSSDYAINSLIWSILVGIPLFIAIVFAPFRLISNTRRKSKTVGFFHPYCNAGGHGERVLWAAIRTMQLKFPDLKYYVYSGDTDATKEQILLEARQKFGIDLDSANIHFIHLKFRWLLKVRNYPRFAMLFQGLAGWILALEAWFRMVPEVFIDSMGYPLSIPIFRAAGSTVVAFVDYPSLACDTLDVVESRQRNFLSWTKLAFNRLFTCFYWMTGKAAAMVNGRNFWNMPPRRIPSDPLLIRSFIMNDVFLGKPVFEGYKDICKILPQFDYPEYDFWFYRFLAGSWDLEYDRSADPEAINLDHMPMEMLEQILEKVDVKQRSKVREVSRRMLAVVDKLKMDYEMIAIYWLDDFGYINIRADDCYWRKNYYDKSAGGNYMEIALHDLRKFLKPSKMRVEHFEILTRNLDISKQIVDLLVVISKKENSKFHVESAEINIQESDSALMVLSLMKPKNLKNLQIGECPRDVTNDRELYDMNRMREMEQFKEAKTVHLYGYECTDLELVGNFEEFDAEMESMGPEDVKRLRDELSKPDNTIFRKCNIRLMNPFENIAEIARALGKYDVPNGRNTEVKQICSIENSEKFLHFWIRNFEFVVEKDYFDALEAKYGVEEA